MSKLHLDMTAGELSELIGHPAFLEHWSDHLDDCERCFALFAAAIELPHPTARRAAESAEPDPDLAAATLIAVGRDRCGLAHALSARLQAGRCTIETARMRVMGGHFAILLRVIGKAADLDAVRERAPRWGEADGMTVQVHRDPQVQETDLSATQRADQAQPLLRLRTVAADRPGIAAQVAGIAFSHGGNIERLDGRTREPHPGLKQFVMEIDLTVADVGSFEQAIKALDLRSALSPHPGQPKSTLIRRRKESVK